jgi:hypothetical protein
MTSNIFYYVTLTEIEIPILDSVDNFYLPLIIVGRMIDLFLAHGITSVPTPTPDRIISNISVEPSIIAKAVTKHILNLSLISASSMNQCVKGKLSRGSMNPRNACNTI